MDKKSKTAPGTKETSDKQSAAAAIMEARETKPLTEGMEVKSSEFGACENCHTTIKGQAVHALGKTWHPEHFVCATCKKPISGQVFNVHDGKPFCEQDYSNKFLNKCRACGLPIKDVTIQALGASWHKEHFVCKTCSTQLAGQGFYERENNPFCQKCFESQFSPKCAGCNKPITETAMMALGKNFHPGCFKCSKCHSSFKEGITSFQLQNNEPVCENCSKPCPQQNQ